jgi:hypothetical protein
MSCYGRCFIPGSGEMRTRGKRESTFARQVNPGTVSRPSEDRMMPLPQLRDSFQSRDVQADQLCLLTAALICRRETGARGDWKQRAQCGRLALESGRSKRASTGPHRSGLQLPDRQAR